MSLSSTAAVADIAANKRVFTDGMTQVFLRGNIDAVDDYFADPYVQDPHGQLFASR